MIESVPLKTLLMQLQDHPQPKYAAVLLLRTINKFMITVESLQFHLLRIEHFASLTILVYQ